MRACDHSTDEPAKPDLWSAPHPRRTADAGVRGRPVQRCAAEATGSAIGCDRCHPDPVRIASSLRPDMIFGRDNNGGFVQMSLDLGDSSGTFDASAWRGVQLDVIGNAEEYSVHLRTGDLTRPWQSYRHSFRAPEQWQTIDLHFEHFLPHRTETPFDAHRLRRIGIVAIGRAFTVDLAVSGVRFFS